MTRVIHRPIPGFVDTDESDLIQPSDLEAMEHVIVDEGVFERVAGESLSALRVVWEDEDGAVWPLDYRDEVNIDSLAGITVTAAGMATQPVKVQRAGVLDATGLNLVPGKVWLGVDGALTQTPPEDGFDLLVGYATGEQRLYLAFSEPIELLEE
jgi:hypothetical protein